MNRRDFLQLTGAAALGAAAGGVCPAAAADLPVPTAKRLPRWRGFNLTEKFVHRAAGDPPFQESDFQFMEEWGFDFARLPMSYLCWTDPGDLRKLREADLKDVDAALELGRKHNVHVNLNLHRAPGYCVNPPKERLDLWQDEEALDACAFQWGALAKRYKGIPSSRLSFDLLNEPANIAAETYVRVVKRLVQAIRAEDPERLIIADGLRWGRDPVPGLIELGIGQSTRGYEPMEISHYKASWVRSEGWAEPTWPLKRGEKPPVDKAFLLKDRIEPWKKLELKGAGVHVGEWGAFNRTPHLVVLAWMRDCLALWKEAGWGWALWNFRGPFGVLDSGRQDVAYEDYHGHKLDREMLKVLQAG
jgi:endoglucanase